MKRKMRSTYIQKLHYSILFTLLLNNERKIYTQNDDGIGIYITMQFVEEKQYGVGVGGEIDV